MGLMAIPWNFIQQYAEANRFNQELTNDLHFIIRRMDNAELRFLSSKK